MKIIAVYNPLSSKEKVALMTEPHLSEQVLSHFKELCKDSEAMRRYTFEVNEGMLLIRWTEQGKAISISTDDCNQIRGNLECAQDAVARIQEQEKREREERRQAIEEVANAFGVPVIQEKYRNISLDEF